MENYISMKLRESGTNMDREYQIPIVPNGTRFKVFMAVYPDGSPVKHYAWYQISNIHQMVNVRFNLNAPVGNVTQLIPTEPPPLIPIACENTRSVPDSTIQIPIVNMDQQVLFVQYFQQIRNNDRIVLYLQKSSGVIEVKAPEATESQSIQFDTTDDSVSEQQNNDPVGNATQLIPTKPPPLISIAFETTRSVPDSTTQIPIGNIDKQVFFYKTFKKFEIMIILFYIYRSRRESWK